MPNNYGIIICDPDRESNAGSTGRTLLTASTHTWKRVTFQPNGTSTSCSVKSGKECDGTFTGHFLIMVHGNYNEDNRSGNLYAEKPKKTYTNITDKIIQYVTGVLLPQGVTRKVYIFACGQGRPVLLQWYKTKFGTLNVWCPCTTAMMGGAINENDIKTKFGI